MASVPEPRRDSNDPFDELDAALERVVETWNRDEEPKIRGRVLELGAIDGEYGCAPTVLLLTPDSRELLVFGYGAVLQRNIARRDIKPGDLLGIHYLGLTEPTNGGRSYHDYKIVHRRADGSPVDPRSESRSLNDVPPDYVDEPPSDYLDGPY